MAARDFLLELLGFGILALFFLFYFNRVFAFLVSHGLRAYTLSKYGVYIDVQAIQISPIAGRIFFKGFRYHGKNETIFIHSGHITWRYWYRKVKHVNWTSGRTRKTSSTGLTGGSPTRGAQEKEKGGVDNLNHGLPCRLLLSIQGLEWFLYNRSTAYEAILTALLDDDGSSPAAPADNESNISSKKRNAPATPIYEGQFGTSRSVAESILSHVPVRIPSRAQNDAQQSRPPQNTRDVFSEYPFLKILPVRIDCNKGAIVMGNGSARCVLIVQFQKASGEIDASQCRPSDQYKQIFNFNFVRPVVQMKPNVDYEGPLESSSSASQSPKQNLPSAVHLPDDNPKGWHWPWKSKHRRGGQRLSRASTKRHPAERGSGAMMNNGAEKRWTGLSRYLEPDERDDHENWRSVDYARISTLLESPALSVSYFWDVPGPVQPDDTVTDGRTLVPNVNGGPSPEWGANLVLEGGSINYGPWADRYRSELQTIFFPRLFKDAVPARRLNVGDTRVSTVFAFFFELRGQVTLRIPTREPSKDSKLNRQTETLRSSQKPVKGRHKRKAGKKAKAGSNSPNSESRPFGWLDVKIGPDSTIRYDSGMTASADGYHSSLELDLRGGEISTSVNHSVLWKNHSLKVSCDLSSPVVWNDMHEWKFDITADTSQLFLLREHIFLLSDLVSDWGAGPFPDYYTFIPFQYHLNLSGRDLKLYLNVNDGNIINDPCDLEDNSFVIISASSWECNAAIPLDKYRPVWNEVPFQVVLHTPALQIRTPPWKTQASFVVSESVGHMKYLSVSGRYGYCTSDSPHLPDCLELDINGSAVEGTVFGYFIRYMFKIKENYFGEDVHFKTMEEYHALHRKTTAIANAADEPGNPHLKVSQLDVIMHLDVIDSQITLPANLYKAENSLQVSIACVSLGLRFTNQYMDLQVDLSPLSLSLSADRELPAAIQNKDPATQAFVDGVVIHAHRLFGLPPSEPTYMCNWDFRVGSITGDCTTEFLRRLSSGMQAFDLTFDDYENSLPKSLDPVAFDVTFLRARVQSLHVWLHIGQAALLLKTDTVRYDTDDWATLHLSKRIHAFIPNLRLICVDPTTLFQATALPEGKYGSLHTTLSLSVGQKNAGNAEGFMRQQQFIRRHDLKTLRGDFLKRPGSFPEWELPSGIPIQHPEAVGASPVMPEPVAQAPTSRGAMHRKGSPSIASMGPASSSDGSSFLSARPLSHSSSFSDGPATSSSSTRRAFPSRTLRRQVSRSSERGDGSKFETKKWSHQGSAMGLGMSRDSHHQILSSPFLAPHFRLGGYQPGHEDFPELSGSAAADLEPFDPPPPPSAISFDPCGSPRTHVSAAISFETGVVAVLTPQVVATLLRLLTELQSTNPVDRLDKLHIKVFSKLLKFMNADRELSNILDLSVNVPFAHCIVTETFPGTSSAHDQQALTELELRMRRYSLVVRLRSPPIRDEELEPSKKLTVMQVGLESAEFSLQEKVKDYGLSRFKIDGSVEDVAFQFCSDKDLFFILQLRTLDLAVQSKAVDYFARLIRRMTTFVRDTSAAFSALGKNSSDQLQDLISYLIIEGASVPDPSILTRPSYVLRAAPDHLRLGDSWKILSRLRQILLNLPTADQRELSIGVPATVINGSAGTRDKVHQALTSWKNLDLVHVWKSIVIEEVYGPLRDSAHDNPETALPIRATINTRFVNLMVDPGPSQSELAFESLTGCILSRPSGNSTSNSSTIAGERGESVVQVHSTHAMIKLDWELCEMLKDVLDVFEKPMGTRPSRVPSIENTESSPETPTYHDYHIIYTTNTSVVTLKSLNLKSISASKGLQSSIILKGDGLASVTLHTGATSSELLSHGRAIGSLKLIRPSVQVSFEERAQKGHDKNLKLAGVCQELSCSTEQELSRIVEIVDKVIGDEVALLAGLLRQVPKPPEDISAQTGSVESEASSLHLNVALFLDTYSIGIILLPSMTYVMTGTVARTSIIPRAPHELILNFDLKEQVHKVLLHNDAGEDTLSVWRVPPVNGRLLFGKEDNLNQCQLHISVDVIRFEAAAIASLLATISRPELPEILKELTSDFKAAKARLGEVLDSSSPIHLPPSSTRKPLTYDCRLAVAGISLHSSTSSPDISSDTREVELNLGCVFLKAANRAAPERLVPEVRLALRHISVAISCYQGEAKLPRGCVNLGVYLQYSPRLDHTPITLGAYHARIDGPAIYLYADTASTVVSILGRVRDTMKEFDLSGEAKYLRRLRTGQPKSPQLPGLDEVKSTSIEASASLFKDKYSLQVNRIQVAWIVKEAQPGLTSSDSLEDLVLSMERLSLHTRTENAAQLSIVGLQLQMMPDAEHRAPRLISSRRSQNSALLPEVVFSVAYVSTPDHHKLAFQAAGKSLDLRLTSHFILPAAAIEYSMSVARSKFVHASSKWKAKQAVSTGHKRFKFAKPLASVLVDADFAGAVMHIRSNEGFDADGAAGNDSERRNGAEQSRQGQFAPGDSSPTTTLRAPGIAFKFEYKSDGQASPFLNGEIMVTSSVNVLYPTVVPLILEITSSVKRAVGHSAERQAPTAPKYAEVEKREEDFLLRPNGILGRCKFNVGLRICKQDFSLSCQPIAKVTAAASFEHVYLTVNSVHASEEGSFFTASGIVSQLEASLQHVYSRESTGKFHVDSVSLSSMNNKHLNGTSGISAILNVGAARTSVNVRQIQDFLLFREIWIPADGLPTPNTPAPSAGKESQAYLVQRAHQVAAASAVPWNVVVAITELKVQVDLGQALGESTFTVSEFWTSSEKSSDWEQNLCLGFQRAAIHATGRLCALVELQACNVRSSIRWPSRENAVNERPLVQGAVSFDHFRARVGFDHHVFVVADVQAFRFYMYNLRQPSRATGDRLVATLEGDRVHLVCTATCAAQATALYQNVMRLAQDKKTAFETSLREVEQYLTRRPAPPNAESSATASATASSRIPIGRREEVPPAEAALYLDTNVVVALNEVSVGIYPSAVLDSQVLKVEMMKAQARFDVSMSADGKIKCGLGLTLGRLRIGVSGVRRIKVPLPLRPDEVPIADIIGRTAEARDGTILRVPRVVAAMQTWQAPGSKLIDYIFKSSFEGKVDVGWNYARIDFIRGLWATHTGALTQRLGKPLSSSAAVHISGGPRPNPPPSSESGSGSGAGGGGGGEGEGEGEGEGGGEAAAPEKITAVVNVPQSSYEYRALQPAIIETPQLRDMGEATPPLEWIGLPRERLPNLTHQIIIVALLGVAREVEEAYSRILGSS